MTPELNFHPACVTMSPIRAMERLMALIQFSPFQPYQHSDTLLKWFGNPFKLGSMISILTKAWVFSLPIPTQPEAVVAQSTSSFERARKVHILSQICWFHCCIPQGRQSTDVEPKNRKTEKQNKNS